MWIMFEEEMVIYAGTDRGGMALGMMPAAKRREHWSPGESRSKNLVFTITGI